MRSTSSAATASDAPLGRGLAWFRARPHAVDALGAVALAVACVLLVAFGEVGLFVEHRVSRLAFAGPIVVAAAANMLGRRHATVSFSLSMVAVAADIALGGSSASIVFALDGLYNASCHGGRLLRRAVLGAAVVAIVLWTMWIVSVNENRLVLGVLQGVAVIGTPIWWGANVRQRNEIAALGEQRLELERARSEDLRHIAEMQRDDAVRDERARMARELHDVVASRLSAIAINSAAALSAPAAAYVDVDAQRAVADRQRTVLETVRTSSVGALDDMRSLITVLRAGDETIAHVGVDASREGLDRLAREAQAASAISINLDLPESRDYDELGEPVRQAIARICGEIIANAVKHAPRCLLTLRMRLTPDVEIAASNTLPSHGAEAAVPSSGIGVRVMRERAAVFGGVLTSGQDSERTWRVDVRIPVAAQRSERAV